MVLDLCEDCGSINIVSRPDGLDAAGRQRFWLQCKDCYAEWYDVEEDDLMADDWMDFLSAEDNDDLL